MSELRQEVLQAEVAIRQLAEEMARAKGIADNVEEVRQRLNEAANLLEQGQKAMEEVQVPLKEAIKTLRYGGEQLSRTAQDLSSKLSQAITDASQEAQMPLREATEALNHLGEQLSRSIQELSSKVSQAVNDFCDRVRQTLQQAYQSMQAQLTAAIEEAQKALSDAANSLTELRTNFESQMNALIRQNEQLLQIVTDQDAEIKRLSKLLTFCLIFSIVATTTGIVILTLLFIRAQ